MKIVIDIPEEDYKRVSTIVDMGLGTNVDEAIKNGTPLHDNATNGQVLLQMFPPSVYFGDNEKHLVLLAKDCKLTCYNNDWWNAPYKADKGDKE